MSIVFDDLNPRPIYQIIHSMIREDGTDEEIARTNTIITWVHRSRMTIERCTTETEMRMIALIYNAHTDNDVCPTFDSIDFLIRKKVKPANLLELVKDYVKNHVDDLLKVTYADLDMYLNQRIQDTEARTLKSILQTALTITAGSIPNPNDKRMPDLSGTKDALGYVMDKFQKGVLVGGSRNKGGQADDKVDTVAGSYRSTKTAREKGQLYIRTGIAVIDDHTGGLRRKDMNAILGYTGQRKTAAVRTIGYNAAKAGSRVFHIPLESDFEEEMASYLVMHAHAMNPRTTITKAAIIDAKLNDEDHAFLFHQIIPDFKKTVGPNLVIREPHQARRWVDIKSMIEQECRMKPVDLVIIDYLTLVSDPEARDKVASMTTAIQDAKQLCLTANDGNGLCFVTPVQGNRKGYLDAADNDGAWDTTGISLYSEMDKSLDNCFYVFSTDELSKTGKVKLGSCKMRRHANIPPSFVTVNQGAGMLVNDRAGAAGEVFPPDFPPPGDNWQDMSFYRL